LYFPGQIVAVKGKADGAGIVATEIKTDMRCARGRPTTDARFMVFFGPYFLDAARPCAQVEKIQQLVQGQGELDGVIFVGPFANEELVGEVPKTYEHIVVEFAAAVTQACTGIQVVIMTTPEDAAVVIPFYPHPKLEVDPQLAKEYRGLLPKALFLGDPLFVEKGDFGMMVVGIDVVFSMGRELSGPGQKEFSSSPMWITPTVSGKIWEAARVELAHQSCACPGRARMLQDEWREQTRWPEGKALHAFVGWSRTPCVAPPRGFGLDQHVDETVVAVCQRPAWPPMEPAAREKWHPLCTLIECVGGETRASDPWPKAS
jgi:hypothetical protein